MTSDLSPSDCWDRLQHLQWRKSEIHDSGARQQATLRACPRWTSHPRDSGVGPSGSHTLHRRHASSRLFILETAGGSETSRHGWPLNTSSNRQRLIAQQASGHHRHPGGRFCIIGPFPAPGDSISKENENCQARTCLKRRTLFTAHKHWLGASSQALSLQTPFIKGLSGVCLLLFTLPICCRSPEPFQINQSNTPL